MNRPFRRISLALGALIFGLATPGLAQTGGSSIAGVVKDDTGGALPGVTVEVASPALIERVRTTVTNVNGEYEVVDLRAGTYTVTFSLTGFKTVRREAIELSSSFTATVNAVLGIGSLEETITVTGESPLIDVRNAVTGRALKAEVIDALPVGRNVYQIGLLVQGATTTAPDVGGNQGAQITNLRVNGVQDNTWLADGLEINGVEADTVTATYYNQGFNAETTVQTSALPAEASGGVTVNMVKKDGSNDFKGDFYSSYTSSALQSDNVSDEQREAGLVAPSATDEIYDLNLGIGGPVLRDRLWFYGSYRRWRVDRLTANTFNIDGSQALDDQILSNWSGRLTLKVSENNRLSAWVETLDKLRGHRRNLSATIQFISPEASVVQPNIGTTASIRWTSTLKSNLLLEGGFASMRIVWGQQYRPESALDAIPRNDLDLSTLTDATPNALDSELDWRKTAGFAVTWIPSFLGSHKLRAGTQLSWGNLEDVRSSRTDFLARYRSGVPDSVIVYNTPITTKVLQDDHAWYVQDSWTIASRLTVNAGIRWQWFHGIIPAQVSAAGRFVSQRSFAEIDNIPNWKDYTPRLAVVYDLFGHGRTVLKGSVSKYVSRTSAGSIVNSFNPARLLNETRTWIDSNTDGVPQVSEIGPTRGGLTAASAVRIDPELRRPYQWEQSVTLEHQLQQSLAVAVSYYHRKFPMGYTTLNVAVSPADYVPVTITNPYDGTPFVVYNQTAASANRVDNVVTNSSDLKSWYNAFQAVFDKRMSNSFQLSGGVTIGADKTCSGASTNPNSLVNNCGYASSDSRFLGNLHVIYRLPAGIVLASHVQQSSGQPLATTYTVTRADIPNLTQVSQSVNLLPVGERRKEGWTLVDLRVSKVFRFGNRSIEPVAEVYNMFNENASLSEVTTVGPTFERVSSNVDGRIVKFGLKILF
jgi:hypothetical protein